MAASVFDLAPGVPSAPAAPVRLAPRDQRITPHRQLPGNLVFPRTNITTPTQPADLMTFPHYSPSNRGI
ncbi:hypothetical protein GCM10009677_46650 [Sphaerisporangium rubeum]